MGSIWISHSDLTGLWLLHGVVLVLPQPRMPIHASGGISDPGLSPFREVRQQKALSKLLLREVKQCPHHQAGWEGSLPKAAADRGAPGTRAREEQSSEGFGAQPASPCVLPLGQTRLCSQGLPMDAGHLGKHGPRWVPWIRAEAFWKKKKKIHPYGWRIPMQISPQVEN